ncbi:hypothetical protein HY357_00005 [Candidatus Roizmanbacteria bacterium]|nr:hypothetical protein [Candidatus Roizmanbacteria bacterium]
MRKTATDLEKDLFIVMKEVAQKNNKPLSWFRFAKKTKHGYRFLANKEAQWKILEEIAKKAAKKYSQFNLGQITDTLSEIVNR